MFKQYLISLNLSNQTINTHIKNMGIGMPLDDFKEDKLMSFIKDEKYTLSKQKALISTASKYRRWKVLPNDALLIELRKLNDSIDYRTEETDGCYGCSGYPRTTKQNGRLLHAREMVGVCSHVSFINVQHKKYGLGC